jgi:hypothetical protein
MLCLTPNEQQRDLEEPPAGCFPRLFHCAACHAADATTRKGMKRSYLLSTKGECGLRSASIGMQIARLAEDSAGALTLMVTHVSRQFVLLASLSTDSSCA